MATSKPTKVVKPEKIVSVDDLDKTLQDFSQRYPSSIEVTRNRDGTATFTAREGRRRLYVRINADGEITHQKHDIVEED